MEKKGQGTAIIIILLGIIVVVLIAIAMRLFNPAIQIPTGQVVVTEEKEDTDLVDNRCKTYIDSEGYARTDPRCATDVCSLGPPFICNDNSLATNMGIKLSISNGGEKTYVISNIEVTNCGKSDFTNNGDIEGNRINSEETETLTIPCNLESGSNFRGNIAITYNAVGDSTIREATGSITRIRVFEY